MGTPPPGPGSARPTPPENPARALRGGRAAPRPPPKTPLVGVSPPGGAAENWGLEGGARGRGAGWPWTIVGGKTLAGCPPPPLVPRSSGGDAGPLLARGAAPGCHPGDDEKPHWSRCRGGPTGVFPSWGLDAKV